MPPTNLLTGFEPFAHWPINSSGEAARALGQRIPSRVRGEILPVDHLAAHHRLIDLLETLRPATCLSMGLWPGDAFRIERYGRRCPGLSDLPGPDEIEGAWNWADMQHALAASGQPVIYSDDAGKYVCDTTYWTLLDFRRRHGYPDRAAFLHVPPLSDTWPLDAIIDAVTRVLDATDAHSMNIASP